MVQEIAFLIRIESFIHEGSARALFCGVRTSDATIIIFPNKKINQFNFLI